MTNQKNYPSDHPAWQVLACHHEAIASQHMRQWFATDPNRFETFSLQLGDLSLDYSRNLITTETREHLLNLAQSVDLKQKIDNLFIGSPVNFTEKRAALHTALRDKQQTRILINDTNVAPLITDCLAQLHAFVDKIHTKSWKGITGKPIQHIVNIGIGGSYLGPKMCCHALKDFAINDLRFHFVSSVDKSLLDEILHQVDPETTLFIISSKTFTTLETLTNARSVMAWMQDKLGDPALKQHFVAITANSAEAQAFGLPLENIFPIWDWIGGRYSIWSAIGLSLMLMIGPKQFQAFLDGAYEMDQHFRHTDFAHNIPVLLALIDVWYMNFFNAQAKAIVPYSHRLRHMIAYLQQAEMESNGKRINTAGQTLTYTTSPIIFGEEGCNGQHSYHQLLHQGQHFIPVDIILVGKTHSDAHHAILLASGLSQAQALMLGKTEQEAKAELIKSNYTGNDIDLLAKHRSIPGNRPSNILFLKQLNPKNLGMLLALYEHQIFVQSALWDINPFDQWGVELGKQLLPAILHEIQSAAHDDKRYAEELSLIQQVINHQHRTS